MVSNSRRLNELTFCCLGLCFGGYGAPGRIRTSDPLVRSQMLYPAELRAHIALLQLVENTGDFG